MPYLELKMSSMLAAASRGDNRGITLISSDGEVFTLTPFGAHLSSYVKSFVEENPEEQELSVPVVDGVLLRKIVEFMQHYESEPMMALPKVFCTVSRLLFLAYV